MEGQIQPTNESGKMQIGFAQRKGKMAVQQKVHSGNLSNFSFQQGNIYINTFLKDARNKQRFMG